MVVYAIDPAVPLCQRRRCGPAQRRVTRRAPWTRTTAPATGGTPLAPPEGAPRFPLPSEITDAPGAEGWRSMYPYFTRFQPEDDKRFWFYNSMHFPEPMPAFDTITGEIPYQAIGANTGRLVVFPP